jgi:hypothetical protein
MQDKLQTAPTPAGPVPSIEQRDSSRHGQTQPAIRPVARTRRPRAFVPGSRSHYPCLFPGITAHDAPNAVHLYYRHVNQAERWVSAEMQRGL